MRTKQHFSNKEMILSGLFTALIAVGAFLQINIPVQPFPMHFTLQFFFVLLAGFFLGGRMGCISVCTYLMIGLAGIPVFASGGGIGYLVRPTFGFLIGFVFAAFTVGKLAAKKEELTFAWLLISALVGMIVMYLCGMFYFYFISNYIISMPVTWKIVLINCCLLTISGDIVLCVMAAAVAKRLVPVVRKLN